MNQLHREIRIRVMGGILRVSRIPTRVRRGEFRREGGLGEYLAAGGNGRNGLCQWNSFWEFGSSGNRSVCSFRTWSRDLTVLREDGCGLQWFGEIRTRVSLEFVEEKLRVLVE